MHCEENYMNENKQSITEMDRETAKEEVKWEHAKLHLS